MLITTLHDALTLIVDWADRPDIVVPMVEPQPNLPTGLAETVVVSDALGEDFVQQNTQTLDLLNIQDRILRPENLKPDAKGVIGYVEENQGLYEFGYRPEDVSRVWVIGDWTDFAGSGSYDDWRPLDITSEDILIATVLMNGWFGLQNRHETRREDDLRTVPADTDILLWTHEGFGEDAIGYWTNAAKTRLHFGGLGLTLMR